MLKLSPADADNIKLLCRLILRFSKFRIPIGKPFEPFSVWDIIPLIRKMLLFNKDLNFCTGMTKGEFAARFPGRFLRESLSNLLGVPDSPLLGLVITLALLHIKDGRFPQCDSLKFARKIEKRYLDPGRKIN